MATRRRLDEFLSPEEQEMRDWEYQESLAPRGGIDLGTINVIRNQPSKLAQIGKEVGTGLVKLIQSTGQSMVGKPIDISGQGSPALGQRGWESYLGAEIGSKLGAGLIGSALFGSQTGRKLAEVAKPTFFNTPEDIAKRVQTSAWSKQLYVTKRIQEKKTALNMIKTHIGADPQTPEYTQEFLSPEQTRNYLSILAVRYPGMDPEDEDIKQAIKDEQEYYRQVAQESLGQIKKGKVPFSKREEFRIRARAAGKSEEEIEDFLLRKSEEE